MDPVLRAILLSWDWRLEVLLVLVVLGTLYVRGWRQLRRRTRGNTRRRSQLATRWRLVSYLAGLVFIGIALLSAIDLLSQQLFFMHMIQHLLLIMIAPPLLLIANPMPFLLWGLPTSWRRKVGSGLSQVLHRESSVRRNVRSATGPGVIWLFWTISVIGWHDTTLYNLALTSELVHDLEHLFFFGAGMLFWWHVTGSGPRIHKQFGLPARIAFTLSAVPPNMALGVVLAFAGTAFYTYYEGVPRVWGIDPATDQNIGGIIMWIPGSMMYIIAALIMIAALLRGESKKPPMPEKEWASEEALAAPGIKK